MTHLEPPCTSPTCPLLKLPNDEEVRALASEHEEKIEADMKAYNRFFHAMYGTQENV